MLWFGALIRRFIADSSGIAMLYVTMLLPIIVGFSVLVIDFSRAGNLHYDLQKGADSYALAAAAELDGAPDSWIRAERALANLVDNTTRFSTSGFTTLASTGASEIDPLATACRARGSISWCFLKDLPDLDSDPITSVHHAAVTSETRFIEVRVNPTNFENIFPVSFLTGNTDDNFLTIGASAVAGFVSGVCDFTPVYICNPYENTGLSLNAVLKDPLLRRRMIELRQQGGSTAQNSPGNYGFLVPGDGSAGADAIRDSIAKIKSPSCYSSRGVEVRPGFIATVRDALNVRFDVYNGPMNRNKNDADYAPASNVRKGYQTTGSGCNMSEVSEPTTDYQRMPRDDCFGTSNCPHASGRVGDGDWDFDTYWMENQFGASKPIGADGTSPASSSNAPPRYDVYRYEIDNNLVGSPSAGGETGLAQCSSHNAPASIDRRLLFGAIINCNATPIGSGASGDEVPPLTFASFFITETVESGPDQIIRVELVDTTQRNGRGTLTNFLRDEAQLYR